jgi:hypothetical protein
VLARLEIKISNAKCNILLCIFNIFVKTKNDFISIHTSKLHLSLFSKASKTGKNELYIAIYIYFSYSYISEHYIALHQNCTFQSRMLTRKNYVDAVCCGQLRTIKNFAVVVWFLLKK